MASVRVITGGIGSKFPSREVGAPVGMSLNTFGLKKLQASITGRVLAEVAVRAIQPAYEQAFDEWPRDAGASGDSITVTVTEVNERSARVALSVGGEKLVQDPRNKSKRDYAPYIEFNGTSTVFPGTMVHAMAANEPTMVRIIHDEVAALVYEGTK